MKEKLWEASSYKKKNSLLSNYEQFISKKFKKNFNQKYGYTKQRDYLSNSNFITDYIWLFKF